jgi:hypothetical protein
MNKCTKCRGDLEPIHRLGKVLFYFCRSKDCKIPYDENGAMLIDPGMLATSLNPLVSTRELSSKLVPGLSPVARAATDALLLGFALSFYQAGIKDGIKLSFDRDYRQDDPEVVIAAKVK